MTTSPSQLRAITESLRVTDPAIINCIFSSRRGALYRLSEAPSLERKGSWKHDNDLQGGIRIVEHSVAPHVRLMVEQKGGFVYKSLRVTDATQVEVDKNFVFFSTRRTGAYSSENTFALWLLAKEDAQQCASMLKQAVSKLQRGGYSKKEIVQMMRAGSVPTSTSSSTSVPISSSTSHAPVANSSSATSTSLPTASIPAVSPNPALSLDSTSPSVASLFGAASTTSGFASPTSTRIQHTLTQPPDAPPSSLRYPTPSEFAAALASSLHHPASLAKLFDNYRKQPTLFFPP